jgi:hypothetical protein
MAHVPALSLVQLKQRLEATELTARDIRFLFYPPEFQSVSDRNSQIMFLHASAFKSCVVDLSDAVLAFVFEMTPGNVRKVRCTFRKRAANLNAKAGHPPASSEVYEERRIARPPQKALRENSNMWMGLSLLTQADGFAL